MVTVAAHLGSYLWGDTINLATSTVVDVVAWAIYTGRIPATDQALWTARLSGAGREYYAGLLLGTNGAAKVRTFP